jgi:iron complex transport system substrate-binding protein
MSLLRTWGLSLLVLQAVAAAPAPQRVVSTVPALTEMLFAIGAGDQVVGVTEFCRYPPEATKREKIGGYTDLNFEKLISLKPDLVVLANYARHTREQCASAKLPTVHVKYDTVSEILTAMQTLGDATGHADQARAVVANIRGDLDKVRTSVAGHPPRPAMLVIGRGVGSFQGLLAAGPGGFLNDLLNIAGGTNVLGDAAQPWPQINIEAVLARKPEVIIELLGERPTDTFTAKEAAQRKQDWNQFGSVPAVASGRVHVLLSDHALIAGPRMVDTARALAEILR